MGTAIFAPPPPQKKAIGAIKTKAGTNDYVGKGTHMQNLVTFRVLRASPM